MCRPEAAGGDDEVKLERIAQCRFELLRPVADDADPLGLDAAGGELARQEGPVLVDAATADEFAARYQYGSSKTRLWQA